MSSCPKSTKPIFKMACFIKEILRKFKSTKNINRKISNLSKTKSAPEIANSRHGVSGCPAHVMESELLSNARFG